MKYLATFYWDPDPKAFTLPWVDHPILWYSLFFALGYLLAYSITSYFLQKKGVTKTYIETFVLYTFIGMLVGARLGHVFFYEWGYFKTHPLKIFFTWEGGLASHGGAIGILVALFLFCRRYRALMFKELLDPVCIAVAVAAGCIRIGNFFNQEILGCPSDLPWAVFFGHPANGASIQPCHPVQLYEALFYFITALILAIFYPRYKNSPGKTAGLFFVLVFTFRFGIEFLKLSQTTQEPAFLHMGQLLSIPFIAFGLYLFFKKS